MPELYPRVSFDYRFSEDIRKSNAGHDWYNKEADFRWGDLFNADGGYRQRTATMLKQNRTSQGRFAATWTTAKHLEAITLMTTGPRCSIEHPGQLKYMAQVFSLKSVVGSRH
jgi:hypothetical protein